MESDIDENYLPSSARLTAINIELCFGDKSTKEKELILNIRQPTLVFNKHGEINLSTLISYLKNEGYPIQKSNIWYYSPSAKLNVYCGNDPIPPNISIPVFEIRDKKLVLLCNDVIKQESSPILEKCQTVVVHKKFKEEEPLQVQKAARRTTERKIGFIIDKVTK